MLQCDFMWFPICKAILQYIVYLVIQCVSVPIYYLHCKICRMSSKDYRSRNKFRQCKRKPQRCVFRKCIHCTIIVLYVFTLYIHCDFTEFTVYSLVYSYCIPIRIPSRRRWRCGRSTQTLNVPITSGPRDTTGPPGSPKNPGSKKIITRRSRISCKGLHAWQRMVAHVIWNHQKRSKEIKNLESNYFECI